MLEGRIEMEPHGVVDLMRERDPGLASVFGTEGIVECPQHDTVLRVGKMHGQEGLVAAFHLEALVLERRIFTQLYSTLAKLGNECRSAGAIQHLAPALTTILGAQHHTIVADSPTEPGVEKMTGHQIRGYRRRLLRPGLPGIITGKDVAAATDGNQTLIRCL